MSAQQPFFSYSSDDDETVIRCAAQDPLRKKAMGIKLNYKEAGLVICLNIIQQAKEGRSIRQIIDSSKKILWASDVMIGVPEIMERLVVSVRFKDGKMRKVAVKNPIESNGE